ncbi:MAG: hypothetical protein IJA48_04235 [Oscillospiraceae bacterium]|nr:hypothetical protein [Oscillospiraceae bacterium]
MKIKVTSQIDVGKILRSRGLGDSDKARKYLVSRVIVRSAPYVPMRQGTLRNTAGISPGGTQVIYPQPYAHYQYTGKVMGPNVLTPKGWRSMAKKGGKRYNGRTLQHRQGGAQWDKQMLKNHKEALASDVAAYVSKEVK